MPDNKQYNVDGTLYEIPDAEVLDFLKDFPKAEEVEVFVSGKDTLGIPKAEVQDFISEVPDAKPLKKKENAETFLSPDLPTIPKISTSVPEQGFQEPSVNIPQYESPSPLPSGEPKIEQPIEPSQ